MTDQTTSEPAIATTPSPTALYRSPRFHGHQTGAHPENPGRLAAIERELARGDLLSGRPEIPFGPAAPDAVARVHAPAYLAALHRLTDAGGGWLDADTMLGPDSLEIALLAAGAAIAAVDAALDGDARRGFVLARPPGHHATLGRGMGFCLLNQIAIAATHALSRGLARVAIVDWDVHHGNGTQDTFYTSDQVLYCSMHQSPLYPGTGAASERGEGAGTGYTINLPLPAGQDDACYRQLLRDHLLPAVDRFHPELILVSAGFDAHAADPLGGMRLTETGFATLTREVIELAAATAEGRVVAILEGGYDPVALARSVVAVLRVLDAGPGVPDPTPVVEENHTNP